MKTTYDEILPFTTKDGSIIRELLHPAHHALHKQSFAEAVVPPGITTLLHMHPLSEEIYHITRGEGLMRLGDETFVVHVGDSIAIAPGMRHNISNTGDEPLHILCACTPPYSDEDTVLL